MKLGLIGAIGGLGKAMTSMGDDILKRRERALAAAQEEAKYQRTRQDKLADTESQRNYETATNAALEDRKDARTAAELKARAAERQEDRSFKVSERKASEAHDTALAKLRSELARGDDEVAKRLSAKLEKDDVKDVEYGAPDAEGYAPVIIITKSGQVRNTGQRVYRPKKEDTSNDDMKL